MRVSGRDFPVLENGSREDRVVDKARRHKRRDGSFVTPKCTGDEGLKIVSVHLHSIKL